MYYWLNSVQKHLLFTPYAQLPTPKSNLSLNELRVIVRQHTPKEMPLTSIYGKSKSSRVLSLYFLPLKYPLQMIYMWTLCIPVVISAETFSLLTLFCNFREQIGIIFYATFPPHKHVIIIWFLKESLLICEENFSLLLR